MKRYGPLAALDGVDLAVRRGELLALLGPNGAGKSTSISLLLGLIRPDTGRAGLFGLDPRRIEARRRIATAQAEAVVRRLLDADPALGELEVERAGPWPRRSPNSPAMPRTPTSARLPDMQTASSITASAVAVGMPHRRVLGAYLEEARSECLRYLRAPGFMLPVMLFPAMFYLLFGVLMAKANGADAARYLLASYGVFGMMSPGLFGFGVSLALERDGGLLTFKRALPMPPGAYLLGKLLMAMAAAGVVILLLLAMALSLGRVKSAPLLAASRLRRHG